jgi:hypothetical protein
MGRGIWMKFNSAETTRQANSSNDPLGKKRNAAFLRTLPLLMLGELVSCQLLVLSSFKSRRTWTFIVRDILLH